MDLAAFVEILLFAACLLAHSTASSPDSRAQKAAEARNDALAAVLSLPTEKEKWSNKTKVDLTPKCGQDFLHNVLFGRWVPKKAPRGSTVAQQRAFRSQMKLLESQLDQDMRSVWQDRGIPQNPWSSRTLCGYYRLRPQISGKPSIGMWCDPKGPRPCCNHDLFGTCGPANQPGCSCERCSDVRKLDHTELMDWAPYNYFCHWRQYSASEACDVMESSPVKELYYVGDSYMQSMYIGLLMILTGKPITGYWKKDTLTSEESLQCSNYGLNYFKSCRAMTESLDDMRHKDAMCGDGRNVTFKAEFKKYYTARFGRDFKHFVKGLVGKEGTYVVVGIGYHVSMDLTLAIKQFLNPAIWQKHAYYKTRPNVPATQRWPQILFSLPMDYGLLKATRHVKRQYVTKQQAYARGIRNYCRRYGVRVLDFTPLDKNVHTFDGIHYGVGVNNMKNQILLNYLATLK